MRLSWLCALIGHRWRYRAVYHGLYRLCRFCGQDECFYQDPVHEWVAAGIAAGWGEEQ